MVRRSILISFAIAALVLLTSCRREDNSVPAIETQDRIIQTASLTDNPNELLLTWDAAPCETFKDVEVELEDGFANLKIRVTVDVENCPPSGITEVVADLGQPLGDRRIWDRAFNDTVALTE